MAQAATVFGLIWAALVLTNLLITNHGLNVVVDLYGKDPAVKPRPSNCRLIP